MMGNCQVRFLGEEGAATHPSLPDETLVLSSSLFAAAGWERVRFVHPSAT
jgi:hypothetical protein